MTNKILLGNFKKLADPAYTTDKFVKMTYDDDINFKKAPWDKLSYKDLKKIIVDFGEAIARKYKEMNASKEDMPDITRELLNFILKLDNEIDEYVPDCKPPLRPGDLTFDDIAGNEDIKNDIRRNYIYPFRYPGLFKNKSKGILMYGPPGTGKTLLARAAVADIPNAAFFAPTPGELKGKYEGETEKNIANVFKCAQQIIDDDDSQYRVAIIFIDEFDSLASARGDDPGMRRSVNALLQAMDGIKAMPDVSVIAATNLPWDIDGAIRRRFSSEIFVDLPDDKAREFIVRKQIAENLLAPGKKVDVYEESNYNFDNTIFDDINKYGRELCKEVNEKEEIKASYFTKSKKTTVEEVKLVDADFVSSKTEGSLLERTGPNEVAKTLIENIKNQSIGYSDIGIENLEYGDLKFGYSGSDMDKMMAISIQISSARALGYGYKPWTVPHGNQTKYYISKSLSNDDDYVLFESVGAEVWGNMVFGNENWRREHLLSDDQAARALNFGFCQGDINTGLDTYSSTIISKDYVNLLLYKYRGMTPNKE